MQEPIVVYVPVFNAEEWASTVILPPDGEYVIMDNGSTDSTVATFQGRDVNVLHNMGDPSRVGNWRACLDHFMKSEFRWMRWLFAGDAIEPGSCDVIRGWMKEYPEERVIVGAFRNDLGFSEAIERPSTVAMRMSPCESSQRAAFLGNWFGPPLAVCIHREVIEKGVYQFGGLEWAADFHAIWQSSAHFSCLVLPDVFGTFCGPKRSFFQARRDSAQAVLETLAVRVLAAQQAFQLGARQEERDRLLCKIEMDAWCGIFQRQISKGQNPIFIAELSRRLPLYLLPRILALKFGRAMKRLVRLMFA